jgi:carbon-monoxide dehydrogenase large subunit
MIPTRFGSGREVQRVEDDHLLTGQGVFTDDVTTDAARIVFVRSPHAHARVTRVDVDQAQAMDGVRLVLTGAGLQTAGVPSLPLPMNFKRPDGSDLQATERHLLATDTVRFVGEPVVAVVADTWQQAQDAAEAVWVEYEPLDAATTLAQALADGAPTVADGPDNIVAQTQYGDRAAVQAAFDAAAHVTRLDITHQRLAAVTLEPRTVLATPRDGRMEVRLSTQMPTGIRAAVARTLGVAETDVRVVVGDVGGGFGMKTGAYAEDLLCAYAAQQSGRAVKWTATRSEDFLSASAGRAVQTHAEIALAADGKVLGLRIHGQADTGAYPTMSEIAIQVMIGPWVQTSVYDIQNIDFQFTAVMTHTAPTGAYRGAGRPEAILNIERLMEEAAREHGFDRFALRSRNFITPEQMPYTNPMAQVYDSGEFEHIMRSAMTQADVAGFEARAQASAAHGKWRGLGVATFLEWTGGNTFEESVNVQILSDGSVEVFTAVMPMGQGIQTSLTQLVADVFDLPPEKIRVVMGDTDRGNGFGSAGSRSIFTGGGAVAQGSQRAMDKARELAAEALEAAAQDLEYAAARFTVKGTDVHISLGDLAARQAQGRIDIDSSTTAGGVTWPNACHLCEVEVDPNTGETEVVAYSSVNDIGRVISPVIVRGQLDGGAVQGIGQALNELVVYEDQGGQLLTGSLMDYAVPHADVMHVDFNTHTDESIPCKTNILGVKGVGELGTIGATPAVVNAVADALARHGRRELAPRLQMPLTPSRLWSMLQG